MNQSASATVPPLVDAMEIQTIRLTHSKAHQSGVLVKAFVMKKTTPQTIEIVIPFTESRAIANNHIEDVCNKNNLILWTWVYV